MVVHCSFGRQPYFIVCAHAKQPQQRKKKNCVSLRPGQNLARTRGLQVVRDRTCCTDLNSCFTSSRSETEVSLRASWHSAHDLQQQWTMKF